MHIPIGLTSFFTLRNTAASGAVLWVETPVGVFTQLFGAMKYVAAFLLAQLGGKSQPSAADLRAILSSVGIDVDAARLDALLAEVAGKSAEALIAAGSGKLASMPACGGAPAAGAAPAKGGAAPAAAAPAAKKEESEEEEMGMGLFD